MVFHHEGLEGVKRYLCPPRTASKDCKVIHIVLYSVYLMLKFISFFLRGALSFFSPRRARRTQSFFMGHRFSQIFADVYFLKLSKTFRLICGFGPKFSRRPTFRTQKSGVRGRSSEVRSQFFMFSSILNICVHLCPNLKFNLCLLCASV